MIVFRTLDRTGDTELLETDTTIAEMEKQFNLHTAPRSKGGLGMLAALGSAVDTAEQVRTWDEVLTADAVDPTRATELTFIPALQGG